MQRQTMMTTPLSQSRKVALEKNLENRKETRVFAIA
jgi:hypothetical protein